MTVGFFSPLPPARTGVADYSAALLREMRGSGQVEVGDEAADIALYHLGNNHLHREIYERALRRPGVVVIHDAVLHHFFLGALRQSEYIVEFAYNYGSWNANLAEALWKERSRSAADPRYFRYPMLKRVAERSLGVVVHNAAAAKAVREHAPLVPVFEVPHLFEQPDMPPAREIDRLRYSLGCGGQTLLCAVFGHLRESKRLMSVLRAFSRLRERRQAVLLVAGEFASTGLARSLEPWLAGEGVIHTGYLAEADFWRFAAAAEVCLNLRYPSAGESSGIAVRLMGIGKPVILTSGDETSHYPATACLRVDAGEAEEDMLLAYLGWLAENPERRLQIGQAARDYVLAQHSLPQAAQLYWRILSDCYHKIRPICSD